MSTRETYRRWYSDKFLDEHEVIMEHNDEPTYYQHWRGQRSPGLTKEQMPEIQEWADQHEPTTPKPHIHIRGRELTLENGSKAYLCDNPDHQAEEPDCPWNRRDWLYYEQGVHDATAKTD